MISGTESIEQARFNMVQQQIRPWGVADERILDCLMHVKREDFVYPAYRSLAFADTELPLTSNANHHLGNCMMAPKVEARLLQDIVPKRTDKVLEIGTGSGYLTALLASLAGYIVSLEKNPQQAACARQNLDKSGFRHVDVRLADAGADHFSACLKDGPWDIIILGGSVSEIPDSLPTLLHPGGRLFAIVGNGPVMRATYLTRQDNAWLTTEGWDTCLPALQGFPLTPRFIF